MAGKITDRKRLHEQFVEWKQNNPTIAEDYSYRDWLCMMAQKREEKAEQQNFIPDFAKDEGKTAPEKQESTNYQVEQQPDNEEEKVVTMSAADGDNGEPDDSQGDDDKQYEDDKIIPMPFMGENSSNVKPWMLAVGAIVITLTGFYIFLTMNQN